MHIGDTFLKVPKSPEDKKLSSCSDKTACSTASDSNKKRRKRFFVRTDKDENEIINDLGQILTGFISTKKPKLRV